jgi:hypothetical protein
MKPPPPIIQLIALVCICWAAALGAIVLVAQIGRCSW